MEAFAPLPIDLFADSSAMLEEDSSNYFSLSQFDMELQQQAQAALLQQDTWQDFDKYLPMDSQLYNSITNNRMEQAQPIFMNNNNDMALLYDPVADLLSPQQQQFKSIYNHSTTNVNNNIKQEYASPESLPYSSPQNNNIQANLSLSPQPSQLQHDMPLFQQTSPISDIQSSPKDSNLPIPSLDFMNWNNTNIANNNNNNTTATTSLLTNRTPSDTTKTTQGKVPIQRLKSNNMMNNTANNVANNASSNGVRQHKKTAHNAIERRYRNNINDRIAELKNAVPALLHAKVKDNNSRTNKRPHKGGDEEDDDGDDSEEYLDGVAVATKLNKATILRKATEYIHHLKKTGEDMRRENQTLQHILSQLPGGSDILQQYYLQKQQREQELQKQRVLERQFQKQQEQQRKASNRKRARYADHQQETLDDYESSSSSPVSLDPVTPPAMTNRIFMALFMCITFFSTSPLTSGPSSDDQYQNHHHNSRTVVDTVSKNLNDANTSPESFLGSLFNFDSGWSALRTVVFIICIIQLLFPYAKFMLFGSSFKLKRVTRTKRTMTPRKELLNNNVTPGELKSRQVYTILEKSMKRQEYLPESTLTAIFPLCKEAIRISSHHILGYDIMYGENESRNPDEEWDQVCKWIKLNETKCLGGALVNTRLTMLYSCFRMINLVDLLDEDSHEHVNQTRARAYATAAIIFSLVLPKQHITERISNYFWSLAVNHSKGQNDDEVNLDSYTEESYIWMQSLAWIDPDQDYNSIEDIPNTYAWEEMMKIIRNQTSSPTNTTDNLPLSISYTAPVIVPIAILSTLHLLDNLCIQFERLINTMALHYENKNNSLDKSLETSFSDIMLLTEPANIKSTEHEEINAISDQQRLAHWLASVGAVVEAIWKNDIEKAERWLPTLLQRVPRSMTCKASTISQKSLLNQLDELIKKAMIHILVGAVFLKSNDVEKQKQGLVELENAEVLRSAIRKLQNKVRTNISEGDEKTDLESTVMILAEFVVSYIGLESWIDSMKVLESVEKEILVEESVSEITLNLRRMIRLPSLQSINGSRFIVDRLSRLGRFVAYHPGDDDSACDLSDTDDVMSTTEENLDSHQLLIKKSDKAQSILRGYT